MQRAKQISESIELGIILALAGGFMDVYSYIGRDHVFANAQTGNILLVGVSISEALGTCGALLLPCGVVCRGYYACRSGTRAVWQRDPLASGDGVL